jgi:hypothetical protein
MRKGNKGKFREGKGKIGKQREISGNVEDNASKKPRKREGKANIWRLILSPQHSAVCRPN